MRPVSISALAGLVRAVADRLPGSIGAAAGLLLPKCPLCWIAISGSFAVAGYMRWTIEIAGVALFLIMLGRMLRHRSRSFARSLLSLAAVGSLLACGAWLTLQWPTRLAICLIVLCISFAITRDSTRHKCACAQLSESDA